MKKAILTALCAILICVLLPPIASRVFGREYVDPNVPAQTADEPIEKTEPTTNLTDKDLPPAETATEPTAAVFAPVNRSFDERFRLPVLHEGEIVSMSLYEYVLGAVLGEMPTSFSTEALKAQAVACRTYALRLYSHRKHGAAAVCTDPGCCMNWVSEQEYAAAHSQEAIAPAEDAVRQTDSAAIYYEGALIDAVFFSCSGGRTEDAADVWGGEVPYLHAVDSPDEQAPHNTDSVTASKSEFAAILMEANEMAVFSEDGTGWVGQITYTNGGGVATAELGGCIFTGVQLRRLFGLYSTAFTLEFQGETAVFTTHGFGHRVGMSQYGADAMAKAGKGYQDILQWYYQGVTVESAKQ